MLKNDKPYSPRLRKTSDMPPAHREVSLEQAVYILQRQGYIISPPAAT